ncbi:MAG TPA: endonuclease/exonuclease/phosphatase family protein, partial [Chitinophagaceae bacterium]|nr:endonuclease/exonuclease/phosphatase family protein [Chitinophagaceae bacterium]
DIYKTTYKSKRKIAYRFREGEITHEHEVAIIRGQVEASPYPTIYCGDNNATPASYTYHYLKGDMQDAFVKKGFGPGGTFYKILPTLRIDVCFVNKALQVQQCTVPQVKLSDHYPVVTDISWKTP